MDPKTKPESDGDALAHCTNCGQHVPEENRFTALNPAVKFCPIHGRRLSNTGKCPLRTCPMNR